MERGGKAGVEVLIFEKIDFKTKAIGRQRKALYNDKENDSTKGYNANKHLYTQHRSIKICEANLDGYEGRD